LGGACGQLGQGARIRQDRLTTCNAHSMQPKPQLLGKISSNNKEGSQEE
jgi:hypothetical protein